MVRWSDLGAGLLAAPRVLLRRDLWLEVLRRALFSRVFVGYALLAFLAFMASRALYTGYAAKMGGIVTLAFAVVAGPLLLLLAGVLLLPYVYWVFNPPAARMLQRYLDLPPPLEEEPAFLRHLVWTLPTLGAVLLVLGQDLVPVGNQWLDLALFLAAIVVVLLAVMNLFARSALAAFYDRADTERFLRATRRQRLLVWLPVAIVIGVLLQFLAAAVQIPVFKAWSGGGGGKALLIVLALAVQALVYAFAAIVFAGALLLACGRAPASGFGGPRTQGLHSETVPYTPPRRRGPAKQAAAAPMSRGRRLALGGTFAVALLAGGMYLGRLPLADWYLSNDEAYRQAPARTAGMLPLDWSQTENRLLAGYVQAGCKGQLDRMRWLREIGAARPVADGYALACAACEGRAEVVEWVLRTQPTMDLGQASIPASGHRIRRDALACAVDRNDLPLTRALLQRGARPNSGGRDSALRVAAAQLNWDMLPVLLRAEHPDPAVLFAVLDAARAQGPQRPAELLPRMLGAGLAVGARDADRRTAYHWAAMHHDLALAQALLLRGLQPGEAGPYDADYQGAQPWMHVVHKAQRENQPLGPEAAELLRLLLPPQADANWVSPKRSAARPNALPASWSPRVAALNDATVREALGAALDLGQLPQDPASWWKFSSPQSAEAFVRSATPAQLMRAENPDAPPGVVPRRLSEALAETGLEPLAVEVRRAVEVKRR